MDKIKTLTLGDAIRIAINRSGLTLEEIGEALGHTSKTVGRWQLDRNAPRFDDLVRLADLTGYDVTFFADTVEHVTQSGGPTSRYATAPAMPGQQRFTLHAERSERPPLARAA
jgi:transcriptional regulator with XRE-family HTH domain